MPRPLLSLATLVALCHLAPSTAVSQATPVRRPADSVQLVTSDIPNFWRAWTLAAGKIHAARVRTFQSVYLQAGSPGLRDWMHVRLMNRDTVRARLLAAGWTAHSLDSAYQLPRGTPARDSLDRAAEPLAERSAAEELVRALARYPRYYAAVRATTLSLDSDSTVTAAIRHGLARLAELYPEARFPDVYFLIGTLSTGGTTGHSGLLIGTEQYASGPATPRDELPQWARVATSEHSFANLAALVVHEAVHSLQQSGGHDTLLRHALGEGIPDFLSELSVGPWVAGSERGRYGRAHERAVWLDFKSEMATDSTIGTWMYNGMVPPPRNHGATDIGYWVGYRIAQLYYERATDKAAAIRELILLPDPERLLAESGYGEYAEGR